MKMAHFVGLDVSVKETAVCVVDEVGEVVSEQKVPPESGLGVSGGVTGAPDRA